jgi:regulator of sigma E protease
MVTTILATVVVLGVLIFVHELGHFLTAKAVDIEVPRFSIGFGPKILGFRRGETEYVLSLLPLGGYVKMAGMEEMDAIEGGPETPALAGTERPALQPAATEGSAAIAQPQAGAVERVRGPRDFESKSLPARALVISAGVIMNLLFAIVAFAVIAMAWGIPGDPGPRIGNVVEELLTAESKSLAAIPQGARVTRVNDESIDSWESFQTALFLAASGDARISFDNAEPVTVQLPPRDRDREPIIDALQPAVRISPVLSMVVPRGAADQAGLLAGDTVVNAGGRAVSTWQEFVSVVEANPGKPVPVTVHRNGAAVSLTLTPRDTLFANGLHVGKIGAQQPLASARAGLPSIRQGPISAIAFGANKTWETTSITFKMLGGMFTGKQSARNIGGPIAIGQMSGQAVRLGGETFLSFMAVLSVSLAVLNLLPVPVLDGGHLVFLAIEGVRGRALSIQSRMRLTQVGFVLILMLMVWAIGNDILRVIGI